MSLAGATTYENLVENPSGLGYYSPNTMLEIETTRGWITVFNPSGAGSLDVKIYDLTNPEDAQIGPDGNIYFILRDGKIYQCTDLGYVSFITDYNTSFNLIGDIGGSFTGESRSLVVDDLNNIYVSVETDLYKLTYVDSTTFAPSIYTSISSQTTESRPNDISSIASHKDGIVYGTLAQKGSGTEIHYYKVILFDGSSTTTLYSEAIPPSSEYEIDNIYTTVNGDIYFSINGGTLYTLDYSDSWAKSTISASSGIEDMIIMSNGVIYTAHASDDTIKTYATTDLSGGYVGDIVGEIEGSYINWDSSYVLGDTGAYTWGWDADDKSFLRSEKVKIYKDGVLLDTITVGDTGTRYYDLNEVGNYLVSLVTTFPFTSDQIYAADSIDVTEVPDSFINVPQTAPQRTNFTVNYMYGSTPSNGLILMKRLDEITGIYETVEFDLLGNDKIAGATYNRNMSLHSTGTYKITLIHNEQVDEMYDVIEITSLYVPPVETVGNSSISSDKSTYAMGETIFAQYAVDYTNYTTYNVNMEVYNIDKDIISYSVPTIDQISYISQTIPITNEYFTGSHSLRLTSYDNTGNKVAVLANKSITIGLVNDGGFGLSLSKYDVMQLEMFVIKAISPTSANVRVWSVERDVQVGGLMTINGSTYLNYAIPRTGNYEITLSSGGFEIVKQYITVHEGFIDDAEIEEVEDDDVTFGTKFESMLSSGAFVALLIIIACVGAFGKIGGVVGVFLGMVVGISISFLMGYLPAWILFIMVLALCVVFVSKLINSFGGGE
jgi:hypothetical protein